MIIAVALGKDFSKAISSHIFIVVFNVRLEHGFRKVIVLVDSGSKENFIFQRFVKENGLINNLIKYIENFIDRYAVTIYRKHDLIIHIKNLEN
jgi:hypothetical protein